MQFYYTMALDFLDALKQKKRTVYPIVRDLLSLILRSGKVPGMMPDEILDWLCPCDEEAFEDEEDRKAFKKRQGLRGWPLRLSHTEHRLLKRRGTENPAESGPCPFQEASEEDTER